MRRCSPGAWWSHPLRAGFRREAATRSGRPLPLPCSRCRRGDPFNCKTIEGRFTVRALEETTPLGVLPLHLARPAAVRELALEQRAELYAAWTLRRQRGAGSRLVCQKDRLPEIGVVALSNFAPFLALHEAASPAG